ncbi:MAG: hypothetical protein JNM93_12875 [Bacteriovoracaceae bacterium]|nr:hypothetical protein [Bacteriovoracaceae bacterium]
MSNSHDKADSFLAIAPQFHLGKLETESFHPETNLLSEWAKTDLKKAYTVLKKIDQDAIEKMQPVLRNLHTLHLKIKATFKHGHKIFLCGCGATGRLSLALEALCRQQNPNAQVISFMAGGDVALIKSIESFEDKVDYGARQLRELGFSEGDLLISCTEGGETPFVIGATEESLKISKNNPYFLFCNPMELLSKLVERSRQVIENPRIEKIEIRTGPMALSGSTRMQASTVLMMGVGLGLMGDYPAFELFQAEYEKTKNFLDSLDYGVLKAFTEEESACYARKEYILYKTQAHLGISILTDTAERSPTFSLIPYENEQDANLIPSLSYLCLKDAKNSEEGWLKLLGRRPRCLEWPEFNGTIGMKRFLGFDIGQGSEMKRAERVGAKQHLFEIYQDGMVLNCRLNNCRAQLNLQEQSILSIHLAIKVLLNAHSTLIMGRLGRFNGNIMTWVRPSNYKLIDRSTRYIQKMLSEQKIKKSYDEIVYASFEMIEELGPSEPIVLKVVEKLKKID